MTSARTEMTKAGVATSADSAADSAADDVIVTAAEVMFSWRPATDASPLDAIQRAKPYFGDELRRKADTTRVERGNSVWWQEWKAQKAEVTAKVLVVPAEHPEDTDDTVQRSIVVTQTVDAPDGRILDESTFTIERVVAKKGKDKWRVEAINFFPENRFFQPTCPPGQAKDPPPDGPCTPITTTTTTASPTIATPIGTTKSTTVASTPAPPPPPNVPPPLDVPPPPDVPLPPEVSFPPEFTFPEIPLPPDVTAEMTPEVTAQPKAPPPPPEAPAEPPPAPEETFKPPA